MVDLNLLVALDALLQEASVTRAAARAGLTTPAMSRALGRLRAVTGDELLVRAGRGMVLTSIATAMRDRVHAVALEARAVLAASAAAPLQQVDRTLVVRCNDAVAAVLIGPLGEAARREAPGLRVCFAAEGAEDAAPLREGSVDLDIGVLDFVEPELRTRLLVRDRHVGIVRRGHRLARGRVSARRFAGERHVAVSRRGRFAGPIDQALRARGLARIVAATVPDFLAALHAVAESDLVSAVPGKLAREVGRKLGIVSFALPVATPEIAVAMAWHPRFDAEPAHRWLRSQVQAILGAPRERGPTRPGRGGVPRRGDVAPAHGHVPLASDRPRSADRRSGAA